MVIRRKICLENNSCRLSASYLMLHCMEWCLVSLHSSSNAQRRLLLLTIISHDYFLRRRSFSWRWLAANHSGPDENTWQKPGAICRYRSSKRQCTLFTFFSIEHSVNDTISSPRKNAMLIHHFYQCYAFSRCQRVSGGRLQWPELKVRPPRSRSVLQSSFEWKSPRCYYSLNSFGQKADAAAALRLFAYSIVSLIVLASRMMAWLH